jgi:hypothetical protein
MAKLGAPTLYRSEMDSEAYKLCLLFSATDEQLAEHFEVSEFTINEWKKKHPSFSMSIRKGKTLVDADIAESLANQALSGKVDACSLWLRNRQPKHWRDKQDIEMTVTQSPFELFTGASADTTPKEEEE